MVPQADSKKIDLSRREALKLGAGGLLGAASLMAGSAALPAQTVQSLNGPKDTRYPDPPHWPQELRQLAPNVYAFVQEGGPNVPSMSVSNAGMIVAPDSLWAFDSLQAPKPARAFIAASKKATGKDFRDVVLSHHDGDHTSGLQFFEHANVFCSPFCRTILAQWAPTVSKTWSAKPNDFGQVLDDREEPRVQVVPNLTIATDMTLFVGSTEVRFMNVAPAHTYGDLIAYLPKEKIAFTGDVCTFWVVPFATKGVVSKWIGVLDRLLAMDIDVIVPGHGPIGGKKELAEMNEYFKLLTAEARKRYDAKMTAGAAAADMKLGRFDNWIGTQMNISNTVRLYQEWDGTMEPLTNNALNKAAIAEYNEIKKKQGIR